MLLFGLGVGSDILEPIYLMIMHISQVISQLDADKC